MDYTRTALLDAIKWATENNLQITRLEAGSKACTQTHHLIQDAASAEQWVRNNGNLGIYPGDSLLIVDVDVKNGALGKASYKKLNLPVTRTVQTPSGGRHFYFRYDSTQYPHLSTTHSEYPGIDFLTHNQNVVLPGSVLANGVDASYQVVNDIDVVDMPPHLLSLLATSEHVSSDHDRMPFSQLAEIVRSMPHADCTYHEWVHALMAIHYESGGSTEGEQLAREWSQKYDRYNEAEFSKKWRSFHDRAGNPVTGASLIRFARSLPVRFEDVRGQYAPMELVAEATVGPLGVQIEEPTPDPYIPTSSPEKAPEKAPEAFQGIAKVLADWIDSNAQVSQPELSRIAALHCISTASKNRFVVGGGGIGTNLFSISVGKTGHGKENPRQRVLDFCQKLIPDIDREHRGITYSHSVAVEHFASGPAVCNEIARRRDLLLLKDEFGEYLMTASKKGDSNARAVVTALMSYFAKPRGKVGSLVYSSQQNMGEAIEYPFLSIMASTTPELFAQAVADTGSLDSGLINRSVILHCQDGELRREVKPVEMPTEVEWWFNNLPEATVEKPFVIPVEPEAEALFWEFRQKCHRVKEYAALWSRSAENATRLAGLVAMGMDSMVVTGELAAWAIHGVTEGNEKFLKMYRENVGRDRAEEAKDESFEQRVIDRIKHLRGKAPKKTTLHPGGEAEKAWNNGWIPLVDVTNTSALRGKKNMEKILHLVEIQTLQLETLHNDPKNNKGIKMINIF
jgi:hypothetical protein